MSIYQVIAPTDGGQPAQVTAAGRPRSEADALEAALGDMVATFSSDFVDARVGERHNTYEHRSRVLRQMAGQLARMREQEAVAS